MHMFSKSLAVAVTVAVVSTGLGGCVSDAPAEARGPTVVPVTMDEYSFAFSTDIEPGRTVFKVDNEGAHKHELVLVRLPTAGPPVEQMLDTGQMVKTLAHLSPREAGEQGVFAVELSSGRYAMLCFVEGEDGEKHVNKGMHAEFKVP